MSAPSSVSILPCELAVAQNFLYTREGVGMGDRVGGASEESEKRQGCSLLKNSLWGN